MTGNTLYGYQLLRPLGTGGMADIYYAENSLGKPAAVKILKLKYSGEKTVHDRFVSEAKTTVQLHHPNIREVYDLGEIDGRPAILMEYLEGQSLWEVLKTQGKVDEEKALDWFHQTVSGLQYGHSRGVIHRDIKPSNLFLTHDRTIKILDFGIAKVKENITMTQTGQTLGTLIYMSPEQVMDPKRVDERTDIYSLGVTFYHLLTGQTPYDITTNSGYVIQKKIVEEDLEVENLEEVWKERLGICLRKEVEGRSWVEVMDVKDRVRMKNVPERTMESFEDEETVVVKKTTPKEEVLKRKKKLPLWSRIRPKAFYISLLILIPMLVWAVWKGLSGSSTDKELLPYYDTESRLWGVKKGEDIIVKPEYHYVHPFSEGMAAVEKGGMSGAINSTGQEIIKLKYDEIIEISESAFAVALNGKWGIIDKTGREVVPLKYDLIGNFSEGLAQVQLNGKEGFVDRAGQEIISLKYDRVSNFSRGLAQAKLNGKIVFINKHGEQLSSLNVSKYSDVEIFSNGVLKVSAGDDQDKYGIIDQFGVEIVPVIFSFIEDVPEENLLIVNKDGEYGGRFANGEKYPTFRFTGGKWGIYDKKGNVIVPLKYDLVRPYSEGFFCVSLNGKFGFIDKKGKEVIPIEFDDAWSFSEGLAEVKFDGKWGFVDQKGKEIIQLKYDGVISFSEGLGKVWLNGKFGFVDNKGREVIPLKYDATGPFTKGLVPVELNRKWGFIDQMGNEVIPIKYDNDFRYNTWGESIIFFNPQSGFGNQTEYHSEGLISVRLNGMWGFVNQTGREVVPLKYDRVDPFSEGLARVELNGKSFYINRKGEYVKDVELVRRIGPNKDQNPAANNVKSSSNSNGGSKYVDLSKDSFKLQGEESNESSNETIPGPIMGLVNSMVFVEGGTFKMGCTTEQINDCYDEERPAFQVTLDSYWIGKYEVTQKQWEAIMGYNPSRFKGCDDCPVENISWEEIQDFISKLNDLTENKYRLPTEAEWEYAARGGKKSKGYKYAGSNFINGVAWYYQNSQESTHIVGRKAPNELGLYDMSGNLWELCSDWFGDYDSNFKRNPSGPLQGSSHVVRGGAWYNIDAFFCRVSIRSSLEELNINGVIGFRLVRTS